VASSVNADGGRGGTTSAWSVSASSGLGGGAMPEGGGMQTIVTGRAATFWGHSTITWSWCSPSRRDGIGPRGSIVTGRPDSM
jgi:hypothetical protein